VSRPPRILDVSYLDATLMYEEFVKHFPLLASLTSSSPLPSTFIARLDTFLRLSAGPAPDPDVTALIESCGRALQLTSNPQEQAELTEIITLVTRLQRSRNFWKTAAMSNSYSSSPSRKV
jgi:hypothetical protein